MFKEKINFILTLICFFLIGLLYSSQLIYYDFFRTFYSFYSAKNANQALDFFQAILTIVFSNIIPIILMFLPTIILLVVRRRMFSFSKVKPLTLITFLLLGFVTHFLALSSVFIGSKDRNSAYELYYNQSLPILSVDRLGLLTTMRIDVLRNLTHWSPNIKDISKIPVVSKDDRFTHPPKTPNEQEKPKEYNMIHYDFSNLIANEDNKEIKEMHQYFSKVPPTEKNEFTGKFEGYNLIFITAEAFSHLGVRKDVTPTLYKLVNEGYYFPDFYVPIWDVSTTDGEYVATNGLIPKPGVWSFSESGKNEVPFVMGNQLRNIGYTTVAYHNHTFNFYDRDISHPNMGYDYKALGNGLDVKATWPESDLEMMQLTIPEYIQKEPFHAYYMTVSGHLLYSFTGNMMAYKHQNKVKDLNLSEEAKAYLATQIELDLAMEHLLKELENHNVADQTLIVMSADHYPYGLDFKTIDELAGHKVERNFELYKSNLIIYTTNMKRVVVDEPVSSLDILPTISNLLGLEYDSRLLMGRDVFSDAPPLVIFRNRSFITEKGSYNAVTGEFTPRDGQGIDKDYIDRMLTTVDQKFYFSAKILEHNYYDKLE